ncbi:MAG: alpha/beta hydrolase [Chthoniobacterales bacterium]|nr:alpha/beta hydrolase [Chthoniobacterales bacterium]
MPDGRPWTIDEVARGARDFAWPAHDGTIFPGLVWEADGTPRAHVLCIHGLSGAAADFGPLGRKLSADGCSVWAINLRGQGHDPDHGRRGHFLDPREWRADLAAFAEAHLGEDVPFFLVGESMGSLVAVDAVANGALRPERLVLSVPVTEIRAPVPDWILALMRKAACVAPRFKLAPMRFVHGKTSIPRLTADDEYMAYLRTIPHRVRGFTLGFLSRFHDLMQEAPQNAARIAVPTLMLSGGRDVFIRPDQSRAFFECLGCAEKEYRFYPDSHHLLWHDVDSQDVLERIVHWIMKGLP